MVLPGRRGTRLRPTGPASSLRLLLVSLVLVPAALLPATASAGPEPGRVVVEGAGNRSAVVEVTEDAVVRSPAPELSGGNGHAAVVVERLDDGRSSVIFAAAVVRAFRDSTAEATGFSGSGTFTKGRYRITLLGDGPVRATWELQNADAPGLRVVARTPVTASFLGRAEPLASGLSEARVDLPQALPAGRQVLQMTLLTGTRTDAATMCATTEDDCPGRTLPLCLPAPAPCSPIDRQLPTWSSTGEPSMSLRHQAASPEVRALRWEVEGYREEPDRLRAAAIVF